MIPAVLILAQAACGVFVFELDFGNLQEKLIALVKARFAVLAIFGIVADPTTEGIGDSKRAMSYEEPYQDK